MVVISGQMVISGHDDGDLWASVEHEVRVLAGPHPKQRRHLSGAPIIGCSIGCASSSFGRRRLVRRAPEHGMREACRTGCRAHLSSNFNLGAGTLAFFACASRYKSVLLPFYGTKSAGLPFVLISDLYCRTGFCIRKAQSLNYDKP
eukprot:701494-Rhodomonas_salina.1